MWTEHSEHPPEQDDDPPASKSRLKRESAALQDLGEALIELPDEKLNRLDLPAELLEAVRLAKSITAHGGLRRQRKFIGKLLRNLDAEPIRTGLEALRNEGAVAAHRHHLVERWRDRMLAEGDGAVNLFVADHADADRQKLRQLVRDARREREQDAAPRSARLLFRYLRDFLTGD
jgi:ribosome-associated protein